MDYLTPEQSEAYVSVDDVCRPEEEGFDSLVDRLMAMEGLDRDEAEVLAEARFASLTAGDR